MIKMQRQVLKLAIFIAFHGKLLNNLFFLCTCAHRFMQDFQLEVFEMEISLTWKKKNYQLNCENPLLYCFCKKQDDLRS